jgi:lipopolysaccharide/colanic/teichoic acid biosynthesis glycosyltransferase
MQRLFDIVFSIFAVIILSPILFLISFILVLTGEHQVFYRQIRIGHNGRKFKVMKFATMLVNSPNIGAGTLTLRNDPRVLPFGSILRKTKLNEIPQLFNIMKGDMSIVGPRPLVPDGEMNYSQEASQLIRSVPPGLTGMGSLVLRDEESFYSHREDAVDFYKTVISPYKQELETWYIKNRSPSLYFKIIIITGISVIMPNFDVFKFFESAPKIPVEMIESRYEQA